MPASAQSGRCPRESISIFLFIYFPSRPWRSRPYGQNPRNCIELFRPAIHRWLASPHRPPPSDAAEIPARRRWRWRVRTNRPTLAATQRCGRAGTGAGVGGSERTDPHWLQLSDAAEPTLAPALAGQNGADARRREGEKSGAYFST